MDKRVLLFIISVTLAFFGVKYAFNAYYGTEEQVVHSQLQPKTEQATVQKEPILAMQKPIAEGSRYCLENAYQQLVFSTIGASLVEINLPFENKAHPNSPVLPIEIDKELARQSPQNDLFPLQPAITADGTLLEPKKGGYYPLLRRAQIRDERLHSIPPALDALNIVSEYPEVAQTVYTVTHFTKNEITFEALEGHRRIIKRFRLPEDPDQVPYCFFVEIEGTGNGHFWLTSGVPEVEWIAGNAEAALKYRVTKNQKSEVEKIDPPKSSFITTSITPDWICNSNGFFGIILDPIEGFGTGFTVERIAGAQVPSRLTLIDAAYNRFQAENLPGYIMMLPLKPDVTSRLRVFAGPFADKPLEAADAFFSKEGKNPDFLSCQTFHGWFAFISEPFADFLFFIMKIFYNLFGSWGLSIILVTVVLRILLYPLNSWSMKSMKRMQHIAPQVKAIQERYKKEPQKAQMEIINLYRTQKVNPVSGCLPLLLQMPFLIGMFDLLKSSFELRGAPFIPGWINDLAAPDVVFSWKTSLPFIGNEFHLLPILLGGVMYLQQHWQAGLPKNRAEWTEQQRQQRTMGNIMTVVMTVLFYNFPSGLNIYWISSTMLGIAQQWWNNRGVDKNEQPVVQVQGKRKK